MSEEEYRIVENMRTYGGSFVKALAECFTRADRQNFNKLKVTFMNYWQEYKEFK